MLWSMLLQGSSHTAVTSDYTVLQDECESTASRQMLQLLVRRQMALKQGSTSCQCYIQGSLQQCHEAGRTLDAASMQRD